MSTPIRPARWRSFFAQRVGPEPIVPVATVADLRALSTREVGPYQTFAVSTAAPTATQHWIYTYTPTNRSRQQRIRLVFMRAMPATLTGTIGFRIGTATTKAATTAIFPIGDPNSEMLGAWTIDECTAANLPTTLYNWDAADAFGAIHSIGGAYPDYWLEALIDPNQVLEIVNRTATDAFCLALGYYTLPIA